MRVMDAILIQNKTGNSHKQNHNGDYYLPMTNKMINR